MMDVVIDVTGTETLGPMKFLDTTYIIDKGYSFQVMKRNIVQRNDSSMYYA